MSRRCKRLSARGRLERRYPHSRPGHASDYFQDFSAVAKRCPGLPVVLACRESGRGQKKNIDDQEAFLRKQAAAHGATVLTCFQRIGSGTEIDDWTGAAEYALATGAALLFESVDRAIRSRDFHTKRNPGAQPTVVEFKKLKRITRGIRLLTIHHPDLPWKQVRGHQARRGMGAKIRPRIDRKQRELLDAVLRKWWSLRHELEERAPAGGKGSKQNAVRRRVSPWKQRLWRRSGRSGSPKKG